MNIGLSNYKYHCIVRVYWSYKVYTVHYTLLQFFYARFFIFVLIFSTILRILVNMDNTLMGNKSVSLQYLHRTHAVHDHEWRHNLEKEQRN